MKRMISLALCLFLLLSLAACGKEEPFPTIVTQPTTAPTEPPTEPSTEPETEPPTEPDPDAPYLERAQALLAAMTQEDKLAYLHDRFGEDTDRLIVQAVKGEQIRGLEDEV